MIAIIDYGMGNIHSVRKAIEFMGAQAKVTNSAKDLQASNGIILPGVGAFGDAILELKKRDLLSALLRHIKRGKLFLGICLGMHILFEASEESPRAKGLGIFKGKVKKIESSKSIKVPHIGWNQLEKSARECPLLKETPDGAYVYFCHSYYPRPRDKNIIAATANYGVDLASMVWQKNVFGVQFHPEKSQETGLKILKNFLGLC